ncbi:Bug family tripartite tricarboxylate transporter substrate binding protein [Orrella marina]|uniref:Tripartite tricarboxylate transporter substrate binding protein n=1 Tax=Orrella marina TaxID=2163011 RepID=A0A2R4XG91_9BURK|nr:tripartite tricarboxylate transporter substrate binding protein [Orrella marina]AWB32832.1 hypothetical protein DBV39_02850 [Orrella marina]
MFKIKGILTGTALALALAGTTAWATDDYPNKTVRIILPFSPGGGADNNARIIAGPLSERLGQPVIIDYKPGAGGTIAANYVAKGEKDGYAILYATPGQQLTNPYLMESLPYDPRNDFDSIIQLIQGTNVLVVHKDLPVNSVEELIEYGEANPGKLNFASSGIGSSSHLAGELFKSMSGLDMEHIPFKGSGDAVAQVIGGRVPMTIDTVSVYLPHIASGAVKALGVSTPERNPMLPDVPPIADDLTGFSAFPVNYLTATAGTPRPIIDKLNRDVNAVLQQPDVREKFLKNGSTVVGGTPEQLGALIESESAKWKKVIEESKASN